MNYQEICKDSSFSDKNEKAIDKEEKEGYTNVDN